MYLYTLAQYFTYFAGRLAVYVEAEGPPASAQQTAWPRLVDALGLTEPVQPGVAVHIPLPGLDPIDGVVDYVTANFLGMRTSDALIRFHGKAPIGMPVGVSHHAYVEGFDEKQATMAWGRGSRRHSRGRSDRLYPAHAGDQRRKPTANGCLVGDHRRAGKVSVLARGRPMCCWRACFTAESDLGSGAFRPAVPPVALGSGTSWGWR